MIFRFSQKRKVNHQMNFTEFISGYAFRQIIYLAKFVHWEKNINPLKIK